MRGTRHSGRERLAAAALVVLLGLSVVAGATGLGGAHGETDHITRNGDTIVVNLGDEHGVKKAKKITVTVEDVKSVSDESDDDNKTDTFRIPVRKLSSAETNLKNAKVTVKAKGKELFNGTVDLRYLRFGKPGEASFSGDTFRVPLKTALGYADDATVPVAIDGKKKAASGRVRYEKNGEAYLAVSFDVEQLTKPLPTKASIRVLERGSIRVNLRKQVRRATRVARLSDGTLLITNPLLAGNTEYDVRVSTKKPSGTFASPVRTSGKGELTVTNQLLARAGRVTVSVYADDGPLVVNKDNAQQTELPATGNVTDNGSAVKILESSLSTNRTAVWLANTSRYVQVSVPVEDGTINLSSIEGLRLHPNGSYRLIVAGEQFVRVRVSGNGSAPDTLSYSRSVPNASGKSSNSNGPFNGLLSDLSSGYAPLAIGGGAILLVGLLGGGIIVKMTGGSRSGTTTGSAAPAAGKNRDENDLTVYINDGHTKQRLAGEATVTASKHGTSGEEERTTVRDGKGTLTLDRGHWHVNAKTNGTSEKKRVKVTSDRELGFTLGPQQVEVTVSDDDGDPTPNVAVTCDPDEGRSETRRTDESGEVSVSVPLGASEVEVSADHEKYASDADTVSFGGTTTASASLALRRLTGSLEVTATVGGTAVAGLPVGIQPREKSMRELGEGRRSAVTGTDGAVTFDGLLVGKYEVRMEVPGGDAFSVQSKRVHVRDGERTRETLDATFEYGLGRDQRDRIASIRRDVESLSSSTSRDVAIPQYYGTVVTDLLNTVERVSGQGHQFATADADPDVVVDALLNAAEEAVRLISNAMTTKRNTDLFGACADMRDERVEWNGSFDPDELFELVGEDRTAQRQQVLEQLRAVDDRIGDERSDLAVVAPARELWEDIQQFVNSERGEDPVRGAAVAFVAGGLLDAVDEVFDHDELRNRLERTVF